MHQGLVGRRRRSHTLNGFASRSCVQATAHSSRPPGSTRLRPSQGASRTFRTRYGRDAVAVFGGGSLTNEKAYLLGKFARVALRTANIDYNGRFCMSSAAAAADTGVRRRSRSAVSARGHRAGVSRPARRRRIPPRRCRRSCSISRHSSGTAADSSWSIRGERRPRHGRHAPPLAPGTDAALANGLLHVLIRDGLVDERYMRDRTEAFRGRAPDCADATGPSASSALPELRRAVLVDVAHQLGQRTEGDDPHGQGTRAAGAGRRPTRSRTSTLRSRLARSAKPSSGFGTLTGQGNGQGGREHGQKADQLPGYRRIDDPDRAAASGVRLERAGG